MENNSLKYRHLTGQEIIDYQNQKLSSAEMHRIEMHMQECSFCDEAMVGVSKMDESMRTPAIMRELRKKGRNKFKSKNKVFDLIGVNTLLILLFVLGMLLFLALYIIRLQ